MLIHPCRRYPSLNTILLYYIILDKKIKEWLQQMKQINLILFQYKGTKYISYKKLKNHYTLI
jgi:hypothetical protein